ncbi:MAG: ArgR family transcriptional regulator [Actinobacteria bacterium HGW-Actinobacteria-10]|jgi:transcriptional regulator of arginine metabolism|nr:MAG: ArgR family transcriptional regulator [Actinobacteria bacterium HGW-Actinobacteria-10]
MRKRQARQDEIRKVVRSERIRTQRDLVEQLEAAGYVCTQATVSRDITEMGLKKLPEGVYVLAEDLHLQRMISELVVNVVHTNQLVLIKAAPGTAPGVAAALDAAGVDGILGSIAGDDTVLVIAEDEKTAQRLQDQVAKFKGE